MRCFMNKKKIIIISVSAIIVIGIILFLILNNKKQNLSLVCSSESGLTSQEWNFDVKNNSISKLE